MRVVEVGVHLVREGDTLAGPRTSESPGASHRTTEPP
jgi:hypothetical protein